MIRQTCLAAVAGVVFSGPPVAAQPLEGPKPARLDGWEAYANNRGEEVLRCLHSALLPPRGVSVDVDRQRMLCVLGEGRRLAWDWRFDVGKTRASQRLWVDVEGGSWLALRTEVAIEPRRPGESWEAWKRRYLDADPARTTVRLETNTLKLEPYLETHHDEARQQWWQRITTDQPELAEFVRQVMKVGKPSGGRLATTLIGLLARFVYAGEELTPVNLEVEGKDYLPGHGAEPWLQEFERSFGRWASWPDPPSLRL